METIELVGGPGDGERYQWQGGDELQYSAGRRALDFTVDTVEPFRSEIEAKYRRSLVTKNLFVFQP